MKVSELFEASRPNMKSIQDRLKKHADYKIEYEKKYGPMNGQDLHSHEAVRRQLLKQLSRERSKADAMYEELSAEDALVEGEGQVEKTLRNKAEATKIPYGILKQVFNRGAAAWRQHHRPGVGQIQWALGRCNSFITGKGEARKADKDLWAKV